MSHKATNWAWEIDYLKPAQKLVLMCLADHHNPSYGCFPSQKQIASDCNISRRSVNTHLDALEAQGLILRETSIDQETYRQRPTRYYLAFESDFYDRLKVAKNCDFDEFVSVDKAVDSEQSRVQVLHTEPCAKNDKSRVQILHTNPVRDNRNIKTANLAKPKKGEFVEGEKPVWRGSADIRRKVVNHPRCGEAFAVSYLDTCDPVDGGVRAKTRYAYDKLKSCEALSGVRVFPPS